MRLKPCLFYLHDKMEEWKDISGYEGRYQVSSMGRVKSLARVSHREYQGDLPVSEKILSASNNGYGYLRLGLTKECKVTSRVVHRLVAKAFVPNPENKPEVNHINGIKTDNRAVNLEWCTKSENQAHSHKIGLRCFKGEGAPRHKITTAQAIEIKYNCAGLKLSEVSELYGICKAAASSIRNGKTWKDI